MTRAAGEVADGFLAHPFTTERYLRQFTLPALEEGRRRREAPIGDFEVALPVFVVTGRTEEEQAESAAAAREQIAFYASTAAYRPVLALHGWEDLQGALARLARTGGWNAMGDLIDDEILATFAIVEEPDRVAASLCRRFAGALQRVSVYQPRAADRAVLSSILAACASEAVG